MRNLKAKADLRGLHTKKRLTRGRNTGGQPFTRGHLYQLLHNPIYVGEIAHKGKTYPGRHDGIVDRDTWEAVQARLDSNAVERNRPANDHHRSLLTGLIFDDSGDRLCPHYAVKKGRRYRYYVSKRRVRDGHNGDDGWRVPSEKLENAVVAGICGFFNDERRLIDALGFGTGTPTEIRKALKGAAEFATRIGNQDLLQPHPDLRELIRRVTLSVGHLQIAISRRCLTVQIGTDDNAADDDTYILIDVPITIRRRGVESKIVLTASVGSTERDDKLIFLVARTRRWFDRIANGKTMSVRDIAREEGMDVGDVSRFLPLAFLAPDIVEAILAGRQPAELTAEKLKRLRFLPPAWEDQRQLLGFTR